METYDAIVIGAGPGGCTAALYLARAGLKTLVLHRSEKEGALAWTSLIENYPGFESLSGYELVEKMRNHARKFGAEIKKGWVNGLMNDGELKMVSTVEGDVYQARAVIVSTGALERANKLPGEQELVGKGVSYCATCDAAFFKNQPVVIVADTEAAFEEAVFVSRFASKITLLVPTRAPKAEAETLAKVKALPNVEYIENAHPKGIVEVDGKKRLTFRVGTEEKSVDASGLFLLAGGSKPSVSFLKGVLDVPDGACVQVDRDYQTAVPGLFAVGDILCNHIKQAVVAAAEGCVAALAVDKYLSGRKSIKMDWA